MPNGYCADPTGDEVLDRLAAMGGGRPDLAWDEIIRIQSEVLPEAVAAFNARLLPGSTAVLVAPVEWLLAPEDLSGVTQFPVGLVAASINNEPHGPLAFKATMHVTLSIVTGKLTNRRAIAQSIIVANLARGCLLHTQYGHTDPVGYFVWDALLPSGLSPLPRQYAAYDGFTAHFEATLFPGSNVFEEAPGAP